MKGASVRINKIKAKGDLHNTKSTISSVQKSIVIVVKQTKKKEK